MMQKRVAKGRAVQLKEQEVRKEAEAKEKRYFEDLWEKDRQKKLDREINEHKLTHRRNQETMMMIKNQINEFKAYAHRLEDLKAEEARLMKHDAHMRALEDQRTLERKMQEKRAVRLELDSFNQQKMNQRQQDVKTALDNDLKLLAEFAKMELEEKQANTRRRAELHKEMQLYRDHLAQQKALENQREKELEAYYSEEQERVFTFD